MDNLMFFSDSQHQLFSCSLLQPLQLLSSPPPVIMSSSAALFFPRSRGVSSSALVDDSAAEAFGPAGSRRAADLATAENEFAFLESKPSLLDERSAKGKAAKGRRHAGEAVLRRKLANQAFLVKVGNSGGGGTHHKELGGSKSSGKIGGGGGSGGRSRRSRVLSEMVADHFAPSVPYSLNRKSRWAQEGADWLAQLANGWAGDEAHKLRLSLAEADFTLAGTESVRALHRLDLAKGGKMVESRWAKSGRGAMLADLARREEDSEEEDRENEQPPMEEIHFQLTRHVSNRDFAGKYFRRIGKQFCAKKRSGVEMISAGSAGPIRSAQSRIVSASGAPIPTESEPEEESEFLAQYRPRQETYSLADFLKDGPAASAPVIIGRRRHRHIPNGIGTTNGAAADEDCQFAIVPELECIELPDIVAATDAQPICANAGHQQGHPHPHVLTPILAIRQRLIAACQRRTEAGFFRQFPLALAISDSSQIVALAEGREEWHPHWIGENLLKLDLSWALAKEPGEQMLILVLSPGQFLVNSLIPLNEQKLANALETDGQLEQKIMAIIETVRTDFAEWDLSRQRRAAANSSIEPFRAILHSQRLAPPHRPLSVQAILGQQRAAQAREESQFVGAEELLLAKGKGEEFEEFEEEEFELIDMHEFVGGGGGGGQPAASPQKSASVKCAECATKSGPSVPLAQLHSCGHKFCWDCLNAVVGKQISEGSADTAIQLHCPICPNAGGQMPLEVLPWLLPLPSANALVLLHHALEGDNGIGTCRQLVQCPGCQGIIEVLDEESTQFGGQLGCAQCQLHWCPKCDCPPHWPLNCAQNGEWTRRTTITSKPSATIPMGEDGSQQQQQVLPSANGPQISGQFAEVCTEARTRRMDTRLGWQLGKHMRRLADTRAERRFTSARKTALYLLEFGTAWLYLCRQQRPPCWAQLKSLLAATRERVECLDNELLFSGSLTDPTTLMAKLADLEQLAEKGLAKFRAALKNGEEEQKEMDK